MHKLFCEGFEPKKNKKASRGGCAGGGRAKQGLVSGPRHVEEASGHVYTPLNPGVLEHPQS